MIGLAKILATLEFNRHDDVLKMVKAGFNEETIIEAIRANEPRYDTSAEALVTLKNAGVSERVISTMLAAARAKTSAPNIDGDGGKLPGEIGVYSLKDGRYVELTKDNREFRVDFQVLNNSVLLALGGSGKIAMRFEVEKVGAGKFRILIDERRLHLGILPSALMR